MASSSNTGYKYLKVNEPDKLPDGKIKELILPVSRDTFYINLGMLISARDIDVPKIISITRELVDKDLEKVNVGFYKFFDLAEAVNEGGYRNRQESLDLVDRIKDLFRKHFDSYVKYKKCSAKNLQFVKVTKGGFPQAELYKNKGMGKPIVYLSKDKPEYYIHSGFMKDLKIYGFSDNQIKECISTQMESTINGVPQFLVKKWIKIPDLSVELEKRIEE